MMSRLTNNVSCISVVVFLSFLVTSFSCQQSTYTVQRVIDGDTFVLNNDERVRLIGIDTPETVHPTEPVEYYGKEASAFTKRMIEGEQVRLEFDVEKYDQYGRLLAYVYLPDGRMLNALLVEQGYAQVSTYPPNVKYAERFRELQREARKNEQGLWAD